MPERLSDARLREIRERLSAVTPWPWYVHRPQLNSYVRGANDDYVMNGVGNPARWCQDANDAVFIADAPQAIAELLAEVERVRSPEVRALASNLRASATTAAKSCVLWKPDGIDPRCCAWCSMACSMAQAADLLDAGEA